MVNARAIFFDRDGVLVEAPTVNNLPKSPKTIKDIKLCKGIVKFCKFYKKKNFYLIMVTNQPDFSRKKNSKKNINQINEYLKKKLNFDDVYVCFSDDDKCIDRKPNPGMIYIGAKKFNLNLRKSFLIGDRWRDIGAGNKANCTTILIEKNYNEKLKFKPKYIVKNLNQIYKIIN